MGDKEKWLGILVAIGIGTLGGIISGLITTILLK